MARAWSAMTRREMSLSGFGRRRRGEIRGFLDDAAEEIGVVVGQLALQDRGHALESHAGVDRRAGRGVMFRLPSRLYCMKTRFHISR